MPERGAPAHGAGPAAPPGPAPRRTPAGAVLAFDFGSRRIGIAAGDTLTARAAPRTAVAMLAAGPDWTAIDREVRALEPRWLVVGIPYNADGRASAMTGAARRFGAALRERYRLDVQYVDERWSSLEAGAALKRGRAEGVRTRRIRREDVDSAAAAIILERWLAGERDSFTGEVGAAHDERR